jgi:hypothetical protein
LFDRTKFWRAIVAFREVAHKIELIGRSEGSGRVCEGRW